MVQKDIVGSGQSSDAQRLEQKEQTKREEALHGCPDLQLLKIKSVITYLNFSDIKLLKKQFRSTAKIIIVYIDQMSSWKTVIIHARVT